MRFSLLLIIFDLAEKRCEQFTTFICQFLSDFKNSARRNITHAIRIVVETYNRSENEEEKKISVILKRFIS